ncbi:MAG: hypothetical protein IT548_05590 [Alphaproteobacteria bacterium]|nr:hypothetical protein [Alphaproteobacteria bacterium]
MSDDAADDVAIAAGRPLIVCDADEVLLQFLKGLEASLPAQGLYLDLASYNLTGAIKNAATREPLTQSEVGSVIKAFHAAGGLALDGVEGAAPALRALSAHAQIVILTNVIPEQRDARRANLARLGMDYPVLPNAGLKGAAVRRMAERCASRVFFVDDIAHHHADVATAWPEAHQIHFVADERLFRMAPRSPHAKLFTRDWSEARDHILSTLGTGG